MTYTTKNIEKSLESRLHCKVIAKTYVQFLIDIYPVWGAWAQISIRNYSVFVVWTGDSNLVQNLQNPYFFNAHGISILSQMHK